MCWFSECGSNCGECGRKCGKKASCKNGAWFCEKDYLECGGKCHKLNSDNHCGSCVNKFAVIPTAKTGNVNAKKDLMNVTASVLKLRETGTLWKMQNNEHWVGGKCICKETIFDCN